VEWTVPRQFGPTRTTFPSPALAKVGCGRTAVVRYFWHWLQAASLSLMLMWAQRMGLIMALRLFQTENPR
jgi:hypothetical protein